MLLAIVENGGGEGDAMRPSWNDSCNRDMPRNTSGKKYTKRIGDMGFDESDNGDGEYNDTEDNSGEGDAVRPSWNNSGNRDMPPNNSGKKYIERIGETFASYEVHSSITDILLEHLDGPWSTFRMLPKDVLASMFVRFGTKYCWDLESEKNIYDAFRNVVENRYRDTMRDLREKSKEKARDAGHVIGDKHRFDIIYKYPPASVSKVVWKQLCKGWNTDKWLKKSESGRTNRNSKGSGEGISRHTGGSIGFDEHCIRLERKYGRKVKWIEVYFDTHLKKESKKKYWAGELDINSLVGFEFISEKSREIYLRYRSDMIKLHGSDLNQHPDDLDVWARVAGDKKGRMFGVGSSDPNFVITGKLSTSTESKLYVDAIRSQEEVEKVRVEMEKELANERDARQELEQKVQQMEKEMKENEEKRQKQFEEFMKKFQPPVSQ
ncbi:putative transposase, Ptta/En/Spm, plant [Helianthus debilis subsp. tardiflorus]